MQLIKKKKKKEKNTNVYVGLSAWSCCSVCWF